MKLTEYKSTAGRHIMVYGPPKVGKTALAIALAKYGYKLWYVDGEDGIKTAFAVDEAGNRLFSDADLANIELIRLPDSTAYPIFCETMLKIVKGGDMKICHAHGKQMCPICGKTPGAAITEFNVDKFTNKDVLVIDSGSGLSTSIMNHITRELIKKNPDTVKPERDDYMAQGFLLNRIFSYVQNAPWNCITISHENENEMENKVKRITPVLGTGNFSKVCAKYFDDVVYCEKVNNKLKQFSNATYANNIVTGSRSGKMIEKEGSRGLIELFE